MNFSGSKSSRTFDTKTKPNNQEDLLNSDLRVSDTDTDALMLLQ